MEKCCNCNSGDRWILVDLDGWYVDWIYIRCVMKLKCIKCGREQTTKFAYAGIVSDDQIKAQVQKKGGTIQVYCDRCGTSEHKIVE